METVHYGKCSQSFGFLNWPVRFYEEPASGTKWAAGEGVACNGSRHSTRGNNRWQKPPSVLLLQRAATCLHILPSLSISLFCGPFISNSFVLISPLLSTFFNLSNLPFFVLLYTFFSFNINSFYLLSLSLFFYVRLFLLSFFPAFPFKFFAFIFICLLIFVCYLPIFCLFLPLRICSLSLNYFFITRFQLLFFSALFTPIFGLCLYLLLFTYIH